MPCDILASSQRKAFYKSLNSKKCPSKVKKIQVLLQLFQILDLFRTFIGDHYHFIQESYIPTGDYKMQGSPPQQDCQTESNDPSQRNDHKDEVRSLREQSIRKPFVKKVYGIVLVQLITTSGFVSIFVLDKGARDLIYTNSWILVVAISLFFVTLICMAGCKSVPGTAPINFIFLVLFTLEEAFFLGTLSARYKPEAVRIFLSIEDIAFNLLHCRFF